jgi:hypothetical protein
MTSPIATFQFKDRIKDEHEYEDDWRFALFATVDPKAMS